MALPNILITGTPGTGKTTLAEMIASSYLMKHLNVSEYAKEKGFCESYDEEYQTYVLDEDKVNFQFFFTFFLCFFSFLFSV